MSNVKTVFEKLNRFVFTIFLLFTHRCETQEVEVKNTQPNFVATKFFLLYTNKGIIISSKWVAPLFVSRGNRLGWKFPPYTCNLMCVYYHTRVYMYIYVKYITCTHRRSRLDPQTFLFRNLVHSLKNFLQNFLVFSKMDAGTEKQLSQNEAFQKWLTSLGAHLFSFGAKGKSTIPFNRQTAKG